MKRLAAVMIAFACLTLPAVAGPMCGVPLPVIEKVQAEREGSQRLNDIVARAFLEKFNNTGPQTNFEGPVWIIDHPKDGVVEFIATSDGHGCVFVAPGHLRDVILKMIYGQES